MGTTPLLKKLRLDGGSQLLIIGAPAFYAAALRGISYDKKLSAKKKGAYDFVQIFSSSQAELESLMLANEGAGKHDCLYWACYPKGTGTIKSDIKRETVWKAFALVKLKPVTQVAIDETWSALRGRPF